MTILGSSRDQPTSPLEVVKCKVGMAKKNGVDGRLGHVTFLGYITLLGYVNIVILLSRLFDRAAWRPLCAVSALRLGLVKI